MRTEEEVFNLAMDRLDELYGRLSLPNSNGLGPLEQAELEALVNWKMTRGDNDE